MPMESVLLGLYVVCHADTVMLKSDRSHSTEIEATMLPMIPIRSAAVGVEASRRLS